MATTIVALNVIAATRLPSASHANGVAIGSIVLIGLYTAQWLLFKRRPIHDPRIHVRTQALALLILTIAVALAASIMSHWQNWPQQLDESLSGKRQVPIATVADLDRYIPTLHNEIVIDALPANCEALPLDYWGPHKINIGWNCSTARIGQPSAQPASRLSTRQLDALRVLITHLDSLSVKVGDDAIRLSVGGDRYGRGARHIWLDYRIEPLETLLPAVDTLCPDQDQCITLKTLLRPKDLGWRESVERARAGESLPDHLLRDSHRRALESEMEHLIDYVFGRDLRQMWQTIRQAQAETNWTIRDIDENVRIVSFDASEESPRIDIPDNIRLNNVGAWRRLIAYLTLTDSGHVKATGRWVSTDATQRPAALVIDSGYYWPPLWLTLAPIAACLVLLTHWLVQLAVTVRRYRSLAHPK